MCLIWLFFANRGKGEHSRITDFFYPEEIAVSRMVGGKGIPIDVYYAFMMSFALIGAQLTTATCPVSPHPQTYPQRGKKVP